MIAGIGVDIIEIRRIEKAINRNREKFLHKIFTEREINYCSRMKNPFPHYALRFAAKEAFVKAAGTGIGAAMGLREIEVVNHGDGTSPYLEIHGNARKWLEQNNVLNTLFSGSHSKESAVAMVVLENEENNRV